MEWSHRNREKESFQGVLRLFHDEKRVGLGDEIWNFISWIFRHNNFDLRANWRKKFQRRNGWSMLHRGKIDLNVICILKSYTPSLTISWALQFAYMYLNVSPFITPLISLQLWVLTEKRMGVYFPIMVLKTSPVKGWSQ